MCPHCWIKSASQVVVRPRVSLTHVGTRLCVFGFSSPGLRRLPGTVISSVALNSESRARLYRMPTCNGLSSTDEATIHSVLWRSKYFGVLAMA